jgi:hypothetical protein
MIVKEVVMELITELQKFFPAIDFSQSLSHELDSLGQVEFLMEIERLSGKTVDPLLFDRTTVPIRQAIESFLRT